MLKNIKLTKHIKTIAILASFLIVFTGMAKAYEVSATSINLKDNNNSYKIKTTAKTVEEFLVEEEISLNELDTMNVNYSDELKNQMEIVIKRAFFVNVSVDGKDAKQVKTNADSVGKLVSELKEKDKAEYILEGASYADKLEPNMQIKLNSVKEVTEIRKDEIPYETVVVENNELEVGTERVKTEGSEGVRETEVKTVYVGGKVSSITDGESKVTKEAVNKVIEKGTKEPEPVVPTIQTNKGSFTVVKELSMRATAYTETGNITASGMRAAVGVVAVDPKVIPLGTKLYIEGYGYAIAGDTGGAIKNNRIDLYFNTERECVNYGVKNGVKVYILGEQM